MKSKRVAIVAGLCLIASFGVAQPAVGDSVTFAHGRDAGSAPWVALNGTVNTGIDGGAIVAYLGDSTYFTGSPHAACQPRCVMALRVSYHLYCTGTPGGPVIDARQRNAKERLVTHANGEESGAAYVIHGVPSGFACTLSFSDRVYGPVNDPNQWKVLKIELRLKTPSTS